MFILLFRYSDKPREEKESKPEKESEVDATKPKTPHVVSPGESVQSQFDAYDCATDVDVRAATFLDVAVLRCLFVSQWGEEGVYWALQFLYRR